MHLPLSKLIKTQNSGIFFRLGKPKQALSAQSLTPEPDFVGVQYAYLEDFERLGGLTEGELSGLDFEFAEDGSYHAFAGDRLLSEGKWALSPDRNFLELPGHGWGGRMPSLIRTYDGTEITSP